MGGFGVFVLVLFIFAIDSFAQSGILAREPSINNDGTVVAFSFQGDIWTVPASGGKATRLTIHEAYEGHPQFSGDGKQIAFTAERYGNNDVFVINANGGVARRITFHSSGDAVSSWKGNDIIFSTSRVVPHGHVGNIRYVLFVPPEEYYALPTPLARSELGRAIGRINEILADESFICIGPGRWGTTNPDLGVHIGYADIYNTRALIELAGKGIGTEPELSYGTHFFQDLVEAKIYPLAIYLEDDDVIFNREFFYNTPNHLQEIAPKEVLMEDCLRLIDVASYKPEHCLELVMDSDKGQAVAFLKPVR